MDANQLRGLRPRLRKYLKGFSDCFRRSDTRAHLTTYIEGQLSALPEKSVEPIAVAAGVAVRTLQEFLTHNRWDHDRMRDLIQGIVRDEHATGLRIGILDETSFVKKGDKTPGVKRQWCGAVGKKENCTVTVHLGYAAGEFHTLIDGELFLPEDWAADRPRCREAGIPDTMTYRPKWQIGLELYDRAVGNEMQFDWLTFDEGYGSKPEFLRALASRQQCFIGEVPRSTVGWLKPPKVVTRGYRKNGRGRGRNIPRLGAGSRSAQRLDVLEQRALRKKRWIRWHVKDGEKGPMVWEVKHAQLYPKDENGLVGPALHLIIARNALDHTEVKYFLGSAPTRTPVGTLLMVAFSRWHVERCFEDEKGEVGLDHYEGRRYVGLKRHLVLSMVSQLFLTQVQEGLRGEKSGPDSVSSPYRDCRVDPVLVAGRSSPGEVYRADSAEHQANTEAKCHGSMLPHRTHQTTAAGHWHKTETNQKVQMAADLAL